MDEIHKTYDHLEGYAGGFSIRFPIEALFNLIRQDLGLSSNEGVHENATIDRCQESSVSWTEGSTPSERLRNDAHLVHSLSIATGEIVIPKEEYVYGYDYLSFEEFCSYIYWRTKIRQGCTDTLLHTPKAFLYLYLYELCNFIEFHSVEETTEMLIWLIRYTDESLTKVVFEAKHEFDLLYSEKEVDISQDFKKRPFMFDWIIDASRILNGNISGILDYILQYSTKSILKRSVFIEYESLIRTIFPSVMMRVDNHLKSIGIPLIKLWLGSVTIHNSHLRFVKEIRKEKVKCKKYDYEGIALIEVTKEGIRSARMDSLGQEQDPGACVFHRTYIMQSLYSVFEIELRKKLGLRSIKPMMADMHHMSLYSPIVARLCLEFESEHFRSLVSSAIESAMNDVNFKNNLL